MSQNTNTDYSYYHPGSGIVSHPSGASQQENQYAPAPNNSQNYPQTAYDMNEYHRQWQQYYSQHPSFQGYSGNLAYYQWQYSTPAASQPNTGQTPNMPSEQKDGYASVVAASAVAYMNQPRAYRPQAPQYLPPQPLFIKEPSEQIKNAAGGEAHWSAELKAYVSRVFDSIETQEEKNQIERILSSKLEYVFRNKVSIDWNKEPIPVAPSRSLAALRGRGSLKPLSLSNKRGGRGLATGMLGNRAQAPGNFQTFRNTTPNKIVQTPKNKSGSDSDMSINSDNDGTTIAPKTPTLGKLSFNLNIKSSVSKQGKRAVFSRSRYDSSDSSDDTRVLKTKLSDSKKPRNETIRPNMKSRLGVKQADDATSNCSSPPESPANSDIFSSRGGKKGARGGRGGSKALAMRFSDASLQDSNRNRKNQRADRFKEHLESSLSGAGSIAKTTSAIVNLFSRDSDDEATGIINCKIVGTMQDLEKPYLRLTRAPLPHEVRPVDVLRKSVEHTKRKWADKSDYHFVCEQFKSIRQDLTVQCIEDEFTVRVYEEHADVALEVGDFEEFHQCNSQLMRLHRHGLGANRRLEFTAYRLLYYLFTLDYLGISMILTSLKSAHRDNAFIVYAMKVREAWASNNFIKFFRLFQMGTAPGKCIQVLNWCLSHERREAAKRIFHAFRPTIDLKFVAKSLGFVDPKTLLVSCDDCLDFLVKEFSVPAMTFMPREKIDCKNVWAAICSV